MPHQENVKKQPPPVGLNAVLMRDGVFLATPRRCGSKGEAVMLWLAMLLLGLLAFGAMHAFIRLCDRV